MSLCECRYHGTFASKDSPPVCPWCRADAALAAERQRADDAERERDREHARAERAEWDLQGMESEQFQRAERAEPGAGARVEAVVQAAREYALGWRKENVGSELDPIRYALLDAVDALDREPPEVSDERLRAIIAKASEQSRPEVVERMALKFQREMDGVAGEGAPARDSDNPTWKAGAGVHGKPSEPATPTPGEPQEDA